jgi:hypothetical protein
MSEISINKRTAKDGTESITYSKSWEKGGLNYRKEVRKVEGGYIIVESKHGKPTGEDDAEWIDERQESVTTENPLDAAKDKSDDEKMFDFIDSPLI